MSKKPKVSKEEYDAQTQRLYAKVGKIAVLSEHLNFAMLECCREVLHVRGLPQNYAQTVLAGQNLGPMRRTWESLIRMFYAGDADAIDMIDHLSNRVEKVTERRNDTIHRVWFIGWGNVETENYNTAPNIKAARNIGKKGSLGGVKFTNKDTKDFEKIIDELEKLTSIVQRFRGCIAMVIFHPDGAVGRPIANFHYDAHKQLVAGPPPRKT
jgi:hypothetical protein